MASQVRKLLYNTRERVLSNDANDATNLLHRAIVELAASVAGRQGGVVHGLTVTVDGVALNVTVSEGLGLLNSGGATADDSVFDWVELESATTTALPAADPANPRWDVVEIAAGDVLELASLRDVFDPDTGTFSALTLDKRRRSSPTITIRSGTPAASPNFPAGITGVIPLAYVYVPAAAVTLTVNDQILCRPMIWGVGANDQGTAPATTTELENNLRGGGIYKPFLGIVPGSVPYNDLTFRTIRCTGHFPGNRSQFVVPHRGAYTLTYGVNADGMAAAPGTNDVFYFYALDAAAALPTGYDSSLAPREFVPLANAATRFGTGIVVSGQQGVLVVGSQAEPADVTGMIGSPAAGAPANLSFVGFGSVTVDRSNWIYLGDMQYRDELHDGVSSQSEDSLYGQTVYGDTVHRELRVGDEITASGFISIWTLPGLGNGNTQDGSALPVTALECHARMDILESDPSSANGAEINMRDERQIFRSYRMLGNSASSSSYFYDWDVNLHVDPANGNVEVISITLDAGDRIELTCHAYRDSILAARR